MLATPVYMWVVFIVAVVLAVAGDLWLFHRTPGRVSLKQALIEISAWVGLALFFNLWIYLARGPGPGIEFLTGYAVEQSLSVDNILVFILIFHAFRVPARLQHKVLFCGVAGALVLRALFVVAGIGLLRSFHAVVYIFGAILLLAGIKLLLPRKRPIQPERNWLVQLTRKVIPVAEGYESNDFWIVRQGVRQATPLLLALVAVEAMDIVFVVDSVPAVLSITRDSFIVYSSNAFAILGLRAMYFALAGVLPRFRFLPQGLAVILIFVGGKMLASEHFPLSTRVSLAVIVAILGATVALSIAFPRRAAEGLPL